jgi:hypothetical protein
MFAFIQIVESHLLERLHSQDTSVVTTLIGKFISKLIKTTRNTFWAFFFKKKQKNKKKQNKTKRKRKRNISSLIY